jgi:heme A synthase
VSSHFLLLVVFAAFVSTVFAALMRDDPREQIRFGARMFAGFVGAGVAIGWLLLPFPL